MNIVRIALTLAVISTLPLIAARPAQAQTEKLLHQFTGSPDGATPCAGPVLKGTTLYGTTMEGGNGTGDTGDGIVYSLTTTGNETILHTFAGNQYGDGSEPYGGLTLDTKGNLFGTTINGGSSCNCGTIYKLTKSGKNYTESVLHSFSGSDGTNPYYVTLVFDKLGNLYGTTNGGGSYGNGTVFKLTPDGVLTTLHNFTGQADGGVPDSGVALDTKGNIYGVAPGGGAYGYGVLYEITAAGAYSVLYNFTGAADGMLPRGAPIFKGGKLYGTTQAGGAGCTWGCGVIFEFTLAKGKVAGKETVLHTFSGTDGYYPMYGPLTFDKLGNLYGTTLDGGPSNLGNVYELAPDGTITTLYNFDQQPDGMSPMGGVTLDTKGNVYTTAAYGGNDGGEYGGGTVIKVTP
ncbi:MAG: choice-of-anchor tandem repeat GloVer-containing protein [Terriglobales bacterium]